MSAAAARFDNTTDDNMARRRAELRRLQALTTGAVTSADSGPPLRPAAASAGRSSSAAPGDPLRRSRLQPPSRRAPPPTRNSDLFPRVPKSSSSSSASTSTSTSATASSSSSSSAPSSRRSQSASRSRSGVSATSRGRVPAGGPRPPPTARRLEQSFGGGSSARGSASAAPETVQAGRTNNLPPSPPKRTRAKSAPPARPPPPPPRAANKSPTKVPPAPGSGNLRITRSSAAPPATTAASLPPAAATAAKPKNPRGRPQPISASSLLSPPQVKAPKVSQEARQRSSSPRNLTDPSEDANYDATKDAPVASGHPPSTPATTMASASTPDVRKTPSVAPGGSVAPPSTARKEFITAMRSVANTPPTMKKISLRDDHADAFAQQQVPPLVASPTKFEAQPDEAPPSGSDPASVSTPDVQPAATQSETIKRLEDAWKRVEQEKQDAMRREAELEAHLAGVLAKQTDASASPMEFKTMVDLADTQGEAVAVKWARAQLQNMVASGSATTPTSNMPGQFGFMSPPGGPTTPRGGIFTPDQQQARPRRMATPYPRHKLLDQNGEDAAAITQQGGEDASGAMLGDDQSSAKSGLTNRQATERKLQGHFVQAANCIPYEYSTDVATFVIRRPYGIETEPDLFHLASTSDSSSYGKQAHVSTPSSLEVVAKISADGSLLCLSNEAAVRYFIQSAVDGVIPSVVASGPGDDAFNAPNNLVANGNNAIDNPQSWKVAGNVDELDRPLGNVTYIDENANEKDYSLDEVYEGAMMCREHYCASLFSTAMGLMQTHSQVQDQVQQQISQVTQELESFHQQQLEQQHYQQQQQLMQMQQEAQRQVEEQVQMAVQSAPPAGMDPSMAPPSMSPPKDVREVGVGTGNLAVPNDIDVPTTEDAAAAKQGKKTKKPKEKKPSSPPPSDPGPDVMSIFIGLLFYIVFGTLNTVFIKAPLRIVSTTFYVLASLMLLSVAWLYMADDHGYHLMGASAVTSGLYNQPGIY